jgi:hypothetical protein
MSTASCGSLAVKELKRPATWVDERDAQIGDVAAAALVQDLEREPAEITQTLNGRRREGNHEAARDPEEPTADPWKESLQTLFRRRALLERFQQREHEPRVRGAAGKAEPRDREH